MSKSKTTKIKIKNKIKGTILAYTFRSDVLFKMFFVKYPHLLKRLVALLLSIPLENIEHFQTINTEMPPAQIGTKFCRLDIVMVVNGKKINLEIQVENQGDYSERCMFHWAQMFTSALPEGNDYSLLPQTIIISILDFVMFDCKEVHFEFAVMETSRHEILSNKQRYHFFELPKMPNIDAIDTTNEKDLWLALFNARTKEELEKLKTIGGDVMVTAVEGYNGITATEEFKELERQRLKARHDEAQALRTARKLGEKHGERRGEKRGEKRATEKWQGIVANVVAEKDSALAEKDATLAEKDATLAEKDSVLADQARIIAELYKLIGEKQS